MHEAHALVAGRKRFGVVAVYVAAVHDDVMAGLDQSPADFFDTRLEAAVAGWYASRPDQRNMHLDPPEPPKNTTC
jgi:hypothetical protein